MGLQFHNHQPIDYNSCYYGYQRFSHINEESFFIDPCLHVITVIGRGGRNRIGRREKLPKKKLGGGRNRGKKKGGGRKCEVNV